MFTKCKTAMVWSSRNKGRELLVFSPWSRLMVDCPQEDLEKHGKKVLKEKKVNRKFAKNLKTKIIMTSSLFRYNP